MRIFILICMFAGLHIKLLSQIVYIYPIMGVNYFSNDWPQYPVLSLVDTQYTVQLIYGMGIEYNFKNTNYAIIFNNKFFTKKSDDHLRSFVILPIAGQYKMDVLDNELALIRKFRSHLYVGLGFKHHWYYRVQRFDYIKSEGFNNWPVTLKALGYNICAGYEFKTFGASLSFSHLYQYAPNGPKEYTPHLFSFTNSNIFEASIYYKFRIAGGKSDKR